MNHLYEHIVQVLGTNHSDEYFNALLTFVGEEPQIDLDSSTWTEYFFNTAGFALSFWKTQNYFCDVYLHLSTPLVNSGAISRYTGVLPNGVLASDNPEVMEAKFCQKPVFTDFREALSPDSVKKTLVSFDVNPLKISFSFTGDENILTLVRLQYCRA